MADKKISELTAITGANTAATDAFVMVDTSTGETKKITREELNNAIEQDVLASVDINGGTIDGTTIGGTTAAAGSFTTVDATGNITVAGTVDGRDVATDGTKLDGIEASATADQTGAEIATALNGQTISSLTALTTTGAVIVGGDFTVNGTTTTINSTTLEVDDKNIVLASGAADAAAANGAGITIDGASATFNYASTGDKWQLNKPLDVTGDVIASGDLTVDTDTLHVDSANNRVGIGTASPVAAMQIKTQTNGNAAFQNSTSVSGGVKINAFNDAANASVPFELDGSTLQFNIAATEKMRLDSSGDVLMGNTVVNPASGFNNQSGFGFDTSAGKVEIASTSGLALSLGRNLSSDGHIAEFRKESTAVGDIQTHGGKLQIGQGNANVQFSNADDAIIPTNGNGTVNDNAVSLGTASARFHDMYSGGSIFATGTDYQVMVRSGTSIQPWYLRSVSDGSFRVHLNGTGDIATFDVNGKVGIGTSPTSSYALKLGGSLHADGANHVFAGSGYLQHNQGTTVSFQSRTSGDVGVNFYSNTYWTVSVTDSARQRCDARDSDSNYARLHWYGQSDSGATSNFRHAWYTGSAYVNVTAQSSNDVLFGGDLLATGNVTAYSSDRRLKENIQTIEGGLDKVCQLRGVTFDWRDDCEERGFVPDMKTETGMIAQELQKVIPDAVVPAPFDQDNDGSISGENYLTVKPEKVIPVLVEAIKELKAEIEELKNASAK